MAALAAGCLTIGIARRPGLGTPRPYMLLILADDLGDPHPGCQGGEITTAHVDAPSRDGLRFTALRHGANMAVAGGHAQEVRCDTVPGIVGGQNVGACRPAGSNGS